MTVFARLLPFASGLVTAAIALSLGLPTRCSDTAPPICSAALGYRVPGEPVWVLAAAAVLGMGAWWISKRSVARSRG